MMGQQSVEIRRVAHWALAFGLSLCFSASMAGEAQGVWTTDGGKSRIQIEPCGNALCGRLVWLAEPNNAEGRPKRDRNNPDAKLHDREVIGIQILQGFTAVRNAPDEWEGGTIYDPESGRSYSGKMSLGEHDELRVRGFVGISLLGRTTTWTRFSR